MVDQCHIAYIATILLLYMLQNTRAVQIRAETFHAAVSGPTPEHANNLAKNIGLRTICLFYKKPSWPRNQILVAAGHRSLFR